MGALQVQPELRTSSEPVTEAKRGIGADAAAAMDNLRNAVGRHLDLARKLARADSKLAQLVGENLAGMDGGRGHGSRF